MSTHKKLAIPRAGGTRAVVLCAALALGLSLNAPTKVYAGSIGDVVINEVNFVPPPGMDKYVEIWNRGSQAVDLTNWYICDQPQSIYFRLLEVPQMTGPPDAPGIILDPGDFLVVRYHPMFPPPNGDYTTRSNDSGTTTHTLRIFLPAALIPLVLRADASNFSIWDHTTGDPDFPSFETINAIRDFVSWGIGGTYTGSKRGCVASDPMAGLWPPPLVGDCMVEPPTPVFVAVDNPPLPAESNLSINYNGGNANDPSDYFIAPATEGERNVMPGDIDDDFELDNNDAALFEGCLNMPATNPPCDRADLDGSGFVDCDDWTLFLGNWTKFSVLPLPELPACDGCMAGDFDGDMAVTGRDVQGYLAVMLGMDNSPQGLCAADLNLDGSVTCIDTPLFALAATGAIDTCDRGDVNGDGAVDGRDIPRFIQAVFTPPCFDATALCGADLNADRRLDADDVMPFVEALLALPPPRAHMPAPVRASRAGRSY